MGHRTIDGMRRLAIGIALVTLLGCQKSEEPGYSEEIVKSEDGFTMKMQMSIAGEPSRVYQTLTDFEHFSEFMPQCSSVEIVSREGNSVVMEIRRFVKFLGKDLVGRVDRIDWAVGFDRNTWIHFLNKSTTFLFSLQVIGRHYQDYIPNEGELLGFPVTLNLIRRDSYIATLTARTTYYHGLIIPTLFLGLDFDGLLLSNFMLQYLVNNYLSFTLGINSTWGNEVQDIERDPFLKISEISLKTVLQF